MTTFTQSELHEVVQRYVRNEREALTEAEAAVVEWKYANDEMFGLFPLFDQIRFRGSNEWNPAKRRWLSKEPARFWYKHGLDSQGKVRIIRRKNGLTTLFTYFGHMVDQMLYGSRCNLTRHILENGRTVAQYVYCLDPHQYSHDVFEYDGDRCVKSVEHSWFVSNGQWEAATWTTTCVFEYDGAGLFRAYRDMGENLGGNSLVYVRPKAKPRGSNTVTERRPFIAYTLDPPINEDAAHWIYCDAYGLEMNIDDEWPVDTVLLAPLELAHVVTEQTSVTSMGTVYAGISSMSVGGDLKKAKGTGAKWILLDAAAPDANANIRAVLNAKLGVVVIALTPQEVADALRGVGKVSSKQLVIAFRAKADCTPDGAQTIAGKIRTELQTLKCAKSRVVIAARLNKTNIMDFMGKPDIDGVIEEGGSFGSTMELLVPIALHLRTAGN